MNFYFLLTFMFLVAFIDAYYYFSLRQVIKGPLKLKIVPRWLRFSYWGFTLFSIGFFLFAMYFYVAQQAPPKFARVYITGFIFIVLLSKITGIFFFLIDDLSNLLLFIKSKLFPVEIKTSLPGKKIGRGTFIKQSGIIASAIPFAAMMYGVVKSAFDYNVIRIKLSLPNLPDVFNGFRIVQISDIHTGSFISKEPLKDAVKLINDEYPDLVLFTGDLVNEISEEALPFIDVLKNIYAPHGVYSILGNHDYGDYFYAKGDLKGKANNYALMRDIHQQLGWDLLLNESRSVHKNGQSIGIIGVENWGDSGRFQKYGNVDLARSSVENEPFKILLSHDPSHWNSIISKQYKDIDLTLSGHTHGFQMGIEIPGYIKWSPSKYLYEQWAGLYANGNQKIYVNRGLGFLGYPGRLGILPEITVIELNNSLV